MSITSMLLQNKNQEEEETPAPPQQSGWVNDLINRRYQNKTERIKRTPIGFQFNRDPFDPSSYYRQLGTFRQISDNATRVVQTEVMNREQAEYERNAAGASVGGINPKFTYDGKSRKYGLKNVSSNTAKAADYWGSKYGIKNVGGYREHGSVPGSDHPKGRALDFMTYKNKKQGTALANDIIRNYKQWNVKYVIWNRHIWSPGRGWRKYSGPSPHTDHVHVSFNK